MKQTAVLLCILLAAHLVQGQYEYFNQYYLFPEWELDNSGLGYGLFVLDTNYVVFGANGSGGMYNLYNRNVSFTGQDQSELLFPLPEYLPYGSFAESIVAADPNHFVGILPVDASFCDSGSIMLFNADASGEVQSVHWIETSCNDTTDLDALSLCKVSDDLFAIPARMYHDTLPLTAGLSYADFNFLKVNSQGDILFENVTHFWQDEWEGLGGDFNRVNQIILEEAGTYLLAGDWLFDWDPFIMRISENGDYIDQFRWGEPGVDDYMPWLVPKNDSLYMFAYSHATGSNGWDLPILDMRVGLFNVNTMDTLWVKSYGHEFQLVYLTDFIATPDGGYAALAYCWNGEDEVRKIYILKVDSEGNEVWFNSYTPPIPYDLLNAFDMEVAPDGGLVLVGNFIPQGEFYWVEWLLKLDACGEMEYNGCPPIVSVEDNSHMTGDAFKLWPNPTNHFLNISTPPFYHTVFYHIRSLDGKSQQQGRINGNSIDVSALYPGMYVLELTDESGRRIGAEPFVVRD